MPGHGSPPDPDLSGHSGRSVTRDSGLMHELLDAGPVAHEVKEYRPPVGSGNTSANGTRYAWTAKAGDVSVSGDRRDPKRARRAAQKAGSRLAPPDVGGI